MMTQANALVRRASGAGAKQVFILSLPRSGSTLLRLMLDTHPEICCPGELSLGQLCENLYRALYFSVGQASTDDEIERVSISTARAREIVSGIMSAYAELKGKSIWVEKTPTNLDYAQRLHETFPDAVYICLHRNLLDLIASGWEMTRFGKIRVDQPRYELWDYQTFLELCIGQTRALLDFENSHVEKTIRVNYERLVQTPSQEMGRLFAFLGLDWDPSLIERVFSTRHDKGPGDPKAEFANKFYTTSIGRGISMEVLSKLTKAPINMQRDLNELLARLGYASLESALSEAATKSDPLASRDIKVTTDYSDINDLFERFFLAKLGQKHHSGSNLRGSVKFIIRGKGGGTWSINLDAHPPELEAIDRHADCTITIRADDLLKLTTGELNVGECYLQARLRVTGNEALALSLGRTLFA